MPEMEKPLVDVPRFGVQESTKGSDAIKHGERIARLSECKKRSRQMAAHLKNSDLHPEHHRYGHDVAGCANYLVFNHYYTVDQVRLAKARTCKRHLLCPFCARARAAKMVEKYLERFNLLQEQNPHQKAVFLTLTVKNGPDLQERFRHLVKAFRKYQEQRRDSIKKGRGYNELSKARGGVFSYEVTNKGNGWHPHLHAVLLVDDFIDQRELSAEWERITGDSKIVDVRLLKPKGDDMAEAFCEVFKYALKFSELSLDDNLEAFDQLKGKRLQGAFGNFWGVKVPEKLTDELLPDLPYLELFYKYDRNKGYDLAEIKECEPDNQRDERFSTNLWEEKGANSAEIIDLSTGELRQGVGAARSPKGEDSAPCTAPPT